MSDAMLIQFGVDVLAVLTFSWLVWWVRWLRAALDADRTSLQRRIARLEDGRSPDLLTSMRSRSHPAVGDQS